ncbi:P-loop containing nucleoside triphosphate hydrolase protein [Phlebopus sp. FC_14]|nr:P-loop containing nucleoside triphosphate hydrolase protein [Phlebopus sp. FC_14]
MRTSSILDTTRTLNIILFGETGVGKSSVINLIAEKPIAEVSPDADGCTMDSKEYSFDVLTRRIRLWDTVGLEEPQMGVNGYLAAIEKALELIRKLSAAGGVDLLLFCIRGNRITATTQSNYRLFYEVLCEKKVPIAIIVTNLERESRMEDWWQRNEKSIAKFGMHSIGHACVTGIQDSVEKCRESRSAIVQLLSQFDGEGRFSMPLEPWLSRLLKGLGHFVHEKGSLKGKDVARTLVKRCHMDVETAQRVAGQLTS